MEKVNMELAAVLISRSRYLFPGTTVITGGFWSLGSQVKLLAVAFVQL
jgi:hypothetical protein